MKSRYLVASLQLTTSQFECQGERDKHRLFRHSRLGILGITLMSLTVLKETSATTIYHQRMQNLIDPSWRDPESRPKSDLLIGLFVTVCFSLIGQAIARIYTG